MEEQLGAQNLKHAQGYQRRQHTIHHQQIRPPLFLEKYQLTYTVVQAYRNISRTCKQYLYGNSAAEQLFILELRNQFKLPFYCNTPVELIKDGAVLLHLFRKEEWLIRLTEMCS